MKKFVALAAASVLAFGAAASASELSDWAVAEYDTANGTGLIPYSVASVSMSGSITRQQLCETVMNLYRALGGDYIETGDSPFYDTDNRAVSEAFAAGIVKGRTETEFVPDEAVTRQEAARIIIKAVEAAGCDAHITVAELEGLCGFTDFGDSQQWASTDLAKAVKYKLMSGVSDTELKPEAPITREQAVAVINRAVDTFSENQINYRQPEILNVYDGMSFDGKLALEWSAADNVESYVVMVKDSDGECVKAVTAKKNSIDIDPSELEFNKNYFVIIGAKIDEYTAVFSEPIEVFYGADNSALVEIDSSLTDKYARVFPDGVPFAEEADAAYNMTTVSFPVWKMKASGEKYSSTMSLTVNRNLADEVAQIFNEIYNSPEQFPIKNVGGYCWRSTPLGGVSQHSYGTCIDINFDENYYCYASNGKAITGSFWKPGENPYSITQNGSVVKAFAKYGWKWGGNAWTTLRDYMPFTYLGH